MSTIYSTDGVVVQKQVVRDLLKAYAVTHLPILLQLEYSGA